MKRSTALFASLGSLALLHAAPEPPPEVDQALRSRVTLFFQAHVDGKPRRAEPLVAEDSKDAFFERAKPRYQSFALKSITYSEDFTRARVTVDCEESLTIVGLGKTVPTKVARLSLWKLVDGEWFWYTDPSAVRETPFGSMRAGAAPSDGAKPAVTRPSPPPPEELRNKVAIDKRVVTLSAAEASTETVTITSGMRGWVTLKLQKPDRPGLSIEIDRTSLEQNQSAKLTLSYKPEAGSEPPKPVTIQLIVEPLGTLLSVRVEFKP
jgi:hypothetical protein